MPKSRDYPTSKNTEDMTFSELTDFWTGYTIMELGRGESLRNCIVSILQVTMRDCAEREKKIPEKHKK